ncbi:hypothetical protein [Goodfellowiella coeruleoviolacea]|nr:hypothetical protein [Goodfellowiella coeruleoviolacea]
MTAINEDGVLMCAVVGVLWRSSGQSPVRRWFAASDGRIGVFALFGVVV